MARTRVQKTIFTGVDSVAPAVGAVCSIYEADTTNLVPIYASREGGVVISNPFITAADGKLAFYVDSGRYDLDIGHASGAQQYPDFLGVNEVVVSSSVAELMFDDVAAMTAGLPINAEQIEPDNFVGQKVSVIVNNQISKSGGGYYIIKTAAQAAADGDVIDGILNHEFVNSGYAAIIDVSHEINIMQAGAIDGGYVDQILESIFTNAKVKKVFVPSGNFILQGASFINVLEGFEFYGAGVGSNFISENGGRDGFYNQLFVKDGAHIHDISLSGSNYLNQIPANPDYQGYNKIGITTQGAATGEGIIVERVGFERMINSHVFVFDGHSSTQISECYTFGDQFGFYADVDDSNVVTDINVAKDPARLSAGTQVYCLTNFYNSGASGTAGVKLFRNNLKNINDSAFAVNGSSKSHQIWGNTSIKDEDGYFGGFGLDFNGGSDNRSWGNELTGHSYGAHIHSGAKDNKVSGNTFNAPTGIAFDTGAQSNDCRGNDCIVTPFGTDTLQASFGRGSGVITRGSSTIRNQTSDQTRANAVDNSLSSGSISDVILGGFGRSRIVASAVHGLKSRQLVEISGVTGVDVNGLWEIVVTSTTEFDLISSTFAGLYVSGGSYDRACSGLSALRDQAGNQTILFSHSPRVEDVHTAVWVSDNANSSQIIDIGLTESNSNRIRAGDGALTSNITSITGLSGSTVKSRNFGGSITVLNGTTETQVTFERDEIDTSYNVVCSNSIADISIRYDDKTVSGFKLKHDNSGFDREASWIIFR